MSTGCPPRETSSLGSYVGPPATLIPSTRALSGDLRKDLIRRQSRVYRCGNHRRITALNADCAYSPPGRKLTAPAGIVGSGERTLGRFDMALPTSIS